MSTTLQLPELFGSMVFNEETMKDRNSPPSYAAWSGAPPTSPTGSSP